MKKTFKSIFMAAVALVAAAALSVSCSDSSENLDNPTPPEPTVSTLELSVDKGEIVADGEQYDNKTIDTISCIYGSRAMSCATVSQGVLSHSLTIYPQRDTIDMQLRDTYIIDSVPYIVAPPDNEGRSKPHFTCRPMVAWSLLVMVLCIVVLLRSVRN